jgi:hypothetical protein
MRKFLVSAGLALVAGVAVTLFNACGSSSTSSSNPATTNVVLSDPAPCEAPMGPYSAAWVTVTDVQASTSSSAAPGDSTFTDLTPNLKSNPQQVNLLGIANNQCFLASLGSTTALQPGSYQQIRIMLAANSSGSTISGNHCTNGSANCVVLAADGSVHTLDLSSEAQTGIKISSGQIAGGAFTVAAGQTKDLDIDFNSCASIVVEGAGKGYRLKPVLRAGEVSTTSTSVTGTLQSGGAAIPGLTGLVALEQKDSSGVDRVVQQTLADPSTGNFLFCPVPAGSYDVVAVAVDKSGNAYAATVTTGVGPGTAIGNIPMVLLTTGSNAQATLQGTVTTAGSVMSEDVSVSALQPVTEGTSTVMVTVPNLVLSLGSNVSATIALNTASTGCSSSSVDCASYTFNLPAQNPNVGTMGGTYTQAATSPVPYTIDAIATSATTGDATCTPSELQATTDSLKNPLSVTAGGTTTAATIAFVGCS